ncbi:uncharacterized protein UTRI_02844 [Ustilago trichophora]|uniref:Uncharacterized protein n=1 Tax=Ustilago trichophora TaxID=86804 RepID=A0A5C3ER59_9BASI|nr:uncharacterized protein UTRI_02844 [Ustilago trichophora]
MPEATSSGTIVANGHSNTENDTVAATPLDLLKAVKEVQERRVAVWREYDDAFDTFLHPSSASATNGPVNGSLNNTDTHPSHPSSSDEGDTANASTNGQRCAGCSTSTVPLSEDLLAQILQITTQALIECGHRLRSIQTELAHSTATGLAGLVDKIQTKENELLRNVVQRDQLRKTTLRPTAQSEEERDEAEANGRIEEYDGKVQQVRGEIAELMQEVYAESIELQLAQA